MENFEQMHLTIIKENHPLIACVTLADIKHLIYDNEVLIGMDSSVPAFELIIVSVYQLLGSVQSRSIYHNTNYQVTINYWF